jgi:AcrR family transcriptional regulator
MEEKKEYYLEQIGKLFLRYGLRGITMEEISDELGVSKKTIYNYFESKADIVDMLLQRHLSNKNESMWEAISHGKNAIEILIGITNLMKETIQDIPPLVKRDLVKHFPLQLKKSNEALKNKIYEYIKQNVLKGIDQGLYRSNLNVELIARHYVVSFDRYIRQEVMDGIDFSIDAYYEEILSYHIRGIATLKGVKILEKIIDPTN